MKTVQFNSNRLFINGIDLVACPSPQSNGANRMRGLNDDSFNFILNFAGLGYGCTKNDVK